MAPKKGSAAKGKPAKKDFGETDDFGNASEQQPPPPAMPPPAAPSFDYEEPEREIVKPANQLPLTEEELNEEVVKMLQAKNPKAPKNILQFNFKEREYKAIPLVDQMTTHYAYDGYLLHKSSDEAKTQLGTSSDGSVHDPLGAPATVSRRSCTLVG